MDYSAFGKTEAESYRAEARERWGDTQAYREYERRSEAETRGREELLIHCYN